MLLELKTCVRDPGILVIELAGRITQGRESSHIEDAVVKAVNEGVRKVVIDVSNVQMIDSSGVGIIAFSFGKVSKHEGRFCVAGATGHVMDIFHTIHLDAVIPFSPSVDEACASMTESAA